MDDASLLPKGNKNSIAGSADFATPPR